MGVNLHIQNQKTFEKGVNLTHTHQRSQMQEQRHIEVNGMVVLVCYRNTISEIG